MSTATLSPDGAGDAARRDGRARRRGRGARARLPRGAGRRRARRRRSARRRSTIRRPLDRSAIFRIASLTKPITAVATMALVEEGVVAPRPGRRRPAPRARRPPGAARARRRARRHRARRAARSRSRTSSAPGSGSARSWPRRTRCRSSGRRPSSSSRASAARRGRPAAHDVDSWIAALGSLPLMYQPGEQWLYNTAAQVLGVLLARATGHRHRDGDPRSDLRAARHGRHGVHGARGPAPPAHDLLPTRRRDRRARGARRPGRQLVEPRRRAVPRRQRLAGVDHRRLLGVRVDGARPAARRAASASSPRSRWR